MKFALVFLAFSWVVACGGGNAAAPTGTTPETMPSSASGDAPAPTADGFDAAKTNKSKCSACHTPQEPGTHTKTDLERILKIHKDEKRVALTEDQWGKMIDYLAKK